MLARVVEHLRRRIAVKLTLTLVGFVSIAILAAGLYLTRALDALAVEALEARLTTTARLLHDEARTLLVRGAPLAETHGWATRLAAPSGSRVTLIAPDGRVLADSQIAREDLPGVANHADRPEVRAALAGRRGRALRVSATVGAPLLYVAEPVTEAGRVVGALRLGLPIAALTASQAAIQRTLLLGGLVAMGVALGIGLFVAGRVTRPVVQMQSVARAMSEGDFGVRAAVRSPDEIGVLGRALNAMAGRLQEKIEDLQREQDKVSAILDAMVEGVIAIDGRDQVLLLNERTRTMFGLGRARGERRPLLEVVRNTDLHRIAGDSRRAGTGVVSRRELRLGGRTDRAIQVHAVPLRLAHDEIGVVMVLHDVTELRRLEQMRTEFVANVSHELRTPLTAIQGYLETLLGGTLEEPEHARRFLGIVARHTERLGRLLSDLTDLSNIELGRVTLRLEPTRLDDVVDSVLAIIAPRAEGGKVAVRSEVGPSASRVRADRDRLSQILINLVDNAVKYTPEGGQVIVSAQSVDAGMLEVAVRDTGVGIPPRDLPRITERFYRVDRARSRELGGTGLGLAIVKHLVIAHGGELRIESEPGRGTTVRFTLPTG